MQIVLLGPPGSGKGTLASDLVRIYKIAHISTGDIFRKNIKEKTPLGLEAEGYISQGMLVPDSVTIGMVEDRLIQPDCNAGFMLDGFPRTLPQAEALTTVLERRRQPLTAVLNISVSDGTVVKRLSSRRVCSGCGRSYNVYSLIPKIEGICDVCGAAIIQRADDLPETILQRLRTYYDQTLPLVQYYTDLGLLIEVNNEGAVGSSTDFVKGQLDARLAQEQA